MERSVASKKLEIIRRFHLYLSMKKQNLYTIALKEMQKPKPNLQKAFDLLNKAMKGGDLQAKYALATWYLHGRYVKRNLKTALKLLREADKGNIPQASFDLAVCYETGTGVPKNELRAFELYLNAALEGDQEAFYEVGRCYYYGLGVEKNRRVAKIWLDRSGTRGMRLNQ